MGQQQSSPIRQPNSDWRQPSRHTIPPPASSKAPKQVIHESFLKLRSVPFKGSFQIASELYLERYTTSLNSLLLSRHNTNKLFTESDILKLIECVLYGLAYLEANHISYKDLTPEHIYFCPGENGGFKMLPPQLIEQTCLEKTATGKRFSLLSPQMIIALRSTREQQYHLSNSSAAALTADIFNKSNIFIMGMILLEVCTLRSSCYCYDEDNFDILDRVIRERIVLVKERYSKRICDYIGLMLDYDHSSRPSAKQLAVMLNNDEATHSTIVPVQEVAGLQSQRGVIPGQYQERRSNVSPLRSSMIQSGATSTRDSYMANASPNYPRTQTTPVKRHSMMANSTIMGTASPSSRQYTQNQPYLPQSQMHPPLNHSPYKYQLPNQSLNSTLGARSVFRNIQNNQVSELSPVSPTPLHASFRGQPGPSHYQFSPTNNLNKHIRIKQEPQQPPQQQQQVSQLYHHHHEQREKDSVMTFDNNNNLGTQRSNREESSDSTGYSIERIKQEIERSRRLMEEFKRKQPQYSY